MIVFLNVAEQVVELYTDTGKQLFDFNNIGLLKEFAGNKEMLYVTNAVKSSAQDVVDLVGQLRGSLPQLTSTQSRTPVLRSLAKGKIHIPDLGLVFDGKYCYFLLSDLYAKHGQDVLEKSNDIKAFLAPENKLLEISSLEDTTKKRTKYALELRAKEDKRLNSILVDKNVDDYLDDVGSGVPDAIEIDLEKGGGGGTSNENSLVSE